MKTKSLPLLIVCMTHCYLTAASASKIGINLVFEERAGKTSEMRLPVPLRTTIQEIKLYISKLFKMPVSNFTIFVDDQEQDDSDTVQKIITSQHPDPEKLQLFVEHPFETAPLLPSPLPQFVSTSEIAPPIEESKELKARAASYEELLAENATLKEEILRLKQENTKLKELLGHK
jgi:hypothetical protein